MEKINFVKKKIMQSKEATTARLLSDQALFPLATFKPKPKPRLYTLGEYLHREERAVEKHEYYNGQIIRLPVARGTHNEIAMNIATAIKFAVKSLPKRYRIFSSDQKIYLPTLNFGLYPDVLVVCEKPEYWDNNEILMTNPVLIVEVLSKSTKSYDRGDKFLEYKTLPSFMEYVLIEQTKYSAETFYREEPNLWRNNIVTDPTGTLSLQSLGCSIQMADIYEHIEFPA